MINFFANILGTLINFIYAIVKDYGVAIIIFTILVKVLTFFMTLKQKQDSLKTAKIQAQIEGLKEKYKNDKLTLNQKTLELYKEEKVSPFSTCLFFIIQIILLFAMLSVVSYPLTYIKKTPKDKIEKYANIISEERSNINNKVKKDEKDKKDVIEIKEKNDKNKNEEISKPKKEEITENVVSNKQATNPRAMEMDIIKRFGKDDKDVDLKMSFLGLDLTIIPKNEINNLKNNFSFKNIIPFILPVAYVVLSIISSMISLKDMEKLTKETNKIKKNDEKKDEDNPSFAETMAETNKNMVYITPILMFTVTLVSPLALALYWFVSALLSIIEVKLIDIILKKEQDLNKNKLKPGEINE